MDDILTQLYYLVEDNLPFHSPLNPMEQALLATLNPQQTELFLAYQERESRREDVERRELFQFLLRLGLHVP